MQVLSLNTYEGSVSGAFVCNPSSVHIAVSKNHIRVDNFWVSNNVSYLEGAWGNIDALGA